MINLSKIVFNSVEEINSTYGTDVEIPNNLPEGCNIVCYVVNDLYNVEFFHPYSLNESLYHYDTFGKRWEWSNESLEQEVADDEVTTELKYIYLRLTEKQGTYSVFTTERLLGVCVYGYNEYDRIVGFLKSGAVLLESGYVYNAERLSYYISDDSDEIVSLDEYIKLFYNSDNTL